MINYNIFFTPKKTLLQVDLEQYETPAHIASHMLWGAYLKGDIEGRRVGDLGAGCGMLSVGAGALGAESVTGWVFRFRFFINKFM